MEQFNNQFSLEPLKPKNKCKEISLSTKEINELLSVRSFRKTDKANSISYKNNLYSLYENGERVSFKEKSPILILETLDGKRVAKYMGNKLELKLTDFEYLTGSQKEQYKNMKRITPSFSVSDFHPWGYKVFLMYLHNSKNLNRYLK